LSGGSTAPCLCPCDDSQGVTATLFVTSTLEEPVNVNNDRTRLKTKEPADVHGSKRRSTQSVGGSCA
jgi:hypothetical protein